MSPFDIQLRGDDNPLSYFSLMSLKRSLAAELGDTAGRFVMKLKRVMHQGRSVLRVTLERRSPAAESLRVVTRNLVSRIAYNMQSHTGDRTFDDKFTLVGANDLECAVFLGVGARRLLLGLCDDIVELDVMPELAVVCFKGIKIVKSGKLGERVAGIVGFMDELASGMSDDAANKGKIIGNIREEDSPEVKVKMLKALLSFYAVDKEIAGLLDELLMDESLEVRVVAASQLGEKGRDLLVNMLETTPAGKAKVAAFIIDKLAEAEEEVPLPLLKRLIARARDPGLRGSIQSLVAGQGEYHHPSFFRDLFDKGEIHGMRRALFHAIVTGVKRSALSWDDFFLKCLGDDDRHIRLGSTNLLGDTGDISSVEPMLAISETRIDSLERDELLRAVEKIQSRLEGAEGGWLSLPKPAETDGALSVPDGAGEGALSAEDDRKE